MLYLARFQTFAILIIGLLLFTKCQSTKNNSEEQYKQFFYIENTSNEDYSDYLLKISGTDIEFDFENIQVM